MLLQVEFAFALLHDVPQFFFAATMQLTVHDEFLIYATVDAAAALLVQLARMSHAEAFDYETLRSLQRDFTDATRDDTAGAL